jgi:hypothetical protein
MANWIIALLVAVGGAGWIYSKLMRSTGNNKTSSLMAAAGIGVLLFLFLYIVLGYVLS